ncbi:collagen binding domain-containing protein [uncultured Oscillibacter sp.]|uniref:collagen binding domain-containing protein n=1 Tax=uncultured Oscillibacter sp. TaxID=876091 RepID=UPI00272C034B|nr:SpaA isopeptide-forming pilin-related protein [uncultured Oscillibacter sp.]
MKHNSHSLRTRLTALLLTLVCVLGLFPTTAFAAADTIKLKSFGMSGVAYQSDALGRCTLHQMYYENGSKTTVGFCGTKGGGMGSSLTGQTWGHKTELSDSTVKTMMAYYYAHSTGVFTDEAKALAVDNVWGPEYTWYMNAWVQACIWRYKQGSISDPVVACAEEYLAVYNNLEGTHYTSIDDELEGKSFRDRTAFILDLGNQGVWGDCKVYEYTFTGAGSSTHPASSVQKVILGELTVNTTTSEKYSLTVKKVDATNPTKGLAGAQFHIQSENGAFSKDVVTGADGTYTLTDLDANTYAVTETAPPPGGYKIDNAGPQYVVLPSNGNNTVTVTFTDSTETTGEGSIRKVDADNPSKGLAGAVIKITGVDNSFVGTYTTGEGGYITDIPWDTLPIGSFVAEEVTPPEGYTKSPDQSKVKQTFVWDGKTDVSLVFENDSKVKIQLMKLDDSNNPLPGCVFNIVKDGQIIGTEATKEDGSITVTDVTEGMYAFVEVSAPAPYSKLTEPVFAHVDQATINGGGTVTVTASDKKLPNLTILKRDAKTGDVIPNTNFEIKGIHYGFHTDVTTGADGTATLTGIPVDSYEVTEISVPDPYVVSDEPTQTIWLEAGDNKQLIFDNQKQPLLKISKIEKGTGEKIPGTVFLLEAIDGDYRHEVTTEANGSVELRVAPGSYRITEKSVPEPYCISDNPTQTISLNGGDEKEVIFENQKKPLLTLSKIDADSQQPIPNTVLTVKALDGTYQDDWKTGEDGKVSLRVAPGTYEVTEKSVPEPYFLPDKDADRTQTITLSPGDEKTLVFRNRKAPELTIFKEDSVAGAPIEGAKFHVTYTSNGEAAEAPATIDFGYIFTDANGEIKVHEQGKRLYPGEYTITEVAPAPGFQMKEPTTQKVIIHGNESKTVTFQNEPLNGLVVEKYDSVTGEALPGCTFQLRYLGGTSGTGGTVIGQKVTGKNGTAIWTGLKSGTYVVEEVDPADGYSIIKSSETVYISDNGTQEVVTVRFDNAPDGMLLIRKVCSVNPSITLANAEFKITYADGTLIGDSNGIYRTDENGEIRISGLKPGKSVIATEVKAPPGFIIDTQSQTIQIKEGRTVTLTFKNQPRGKLIIQKRDSITGQPLPGAQFRVTTAAGCEVGLDGVIGTATLTQNGIFTTDSNGEIRISNLSPGALVLTEIQSPSGYVMDSPSTNVVIGPNGDTQTVVITNTPKGGLLIRKIDSVTGKSLPGVKFKITAANGELVPDNEGLTSSNGLYTTDENGQIYLRKLNPNTYVVTEVETLDGYLLDAMPQTVVVSEADTQVLTFTNMPLGGLLVKKMDSATKEPLADVIFKITRTDGTVVGNSNGEFRTDERGFISLPDLEPGSYIVREVQAKPGYLLDDTPHAVEIKDHQTYTLEVFNHPLGNLIINKLDSIDNSPLEGVKFQIKYANGQVVDNKNGQISSNGIYYTDRNGQIILSGITGTVVVTELETLPGYRIDPNTRTQTVVVNPNDTQTLNFYNTPTTTLIIRKFVEGTENEPLSGVAFRVVDGAGAAVGPDDGLYYTDKSGEIVLTGIEPGTVVIAREVKTVEGFVLDGTPQDIKIEAGHVQQLTFWNKRAGTLVIQKKDKVSGNPIPGVEFQLTYANGGFVDNDNGHLSSNGLYKTDDKGEIRVSGVVGTIVAKETKAAPGYVIDQTTQTQTVTVNPMDTQTLTFLNEPLCSLTLTKLDSVSGKPVPNTEFTVKDGDGNVMGRYVTGKDGTVVVTGLTPGSTVVVAESRVPDGYVLNTTPKIIIVKNGSGNNFISGGNTGANGTISGNNSTGNSGSSSNGSSGNGNGLIFENDPKVTLTIHKYIEGSANKPLAGVGFKITDGSGKALGSDGGTYYTNNAGEIVVEGLEPGTTVIAREFKTVDGYVLDGTPQTIKIEAGKGANLTFWNKPAGSLVIRKLDKLTGKPLAGVEFEAIYAEGGYVDTNDGHLSSKGLYTTDAHGEIHISGIVGTVVVKETRPLPGYTIEPGRESQTVTVNPQETQTLTFYNIPSNTLTIQKYIDGADNTPLSGVEFLVTDSSGAAVGSANGYFTTDKDGRISIPGLTPGTTITVKETKTQEGYILDNQPQSILIKEGEAHTLTFRNKKAGTLVIQKKDKVSGNPIAGAEFQLTYSTGGFVDDDNGHLSSKGVYKTDDKGEIRISGIVGTIVAKETKAAPGYVIDQTTQTQTVTVNPADTQTLTFLNEPLCSLTLTKLDSVTGKPVPNTEFTVKDGDGNVLGRYTTGEDGTVVVTGLIPGSTVVVSESRVPDGYVLDTTPKSIIVKNGSGNSFTSGGTGTSSGGSSNGGSGNGLTFENDPKVTLTIHKYIEGTANEPLAGVGFKITDSSGKAIGPDGGTYYTNSAGEIVVEGLEPGTSITAREIKTVDGYVLDGNPQTVKIEAGKGANLTFWNKKAGGLIVNKIDAVTKDPLAGVKFKITYADGSNVDMDGGKISSNGIYTTDSTGQIKILGIVGTVIVEEIETIPGYIIDPNAKSQTVKINPNDTQTITFTNAPKQTLVIQKLVTGTKDQPLAGVEFLITDSSGATVGPNNGIYRTDAQGRITLSDLTPGTVITAKETKTVDGYVLDSTPQSMEIKSGEVQTLTFYNSAIGGLELIKVSASDETKRIPNTTFEIRKKDGALVETITTDSTGRVHVDLDAGDYYAVETKAGDGFKLDATPRYFTVEDNKCTTLTVTNKAFSGILIHKIDSATKKGIYGVSFLLYDSTNKPIGQYTSDDQGYVYIEDITEAGRYYLKELENTGYLVDTQMKTVYVKPGETTLIEWENTAITGQIQITKTSEDYNSMNGWPAGTPIPNTVFEIYDRANNLVDTIRTDKNGLASSRPLPLGRYKVVESQSAEFYGLDKTPMETEIEFSGQIVRLAMTNKALYTNVSINKRGYAQVMPGQQIRYDFTGIANNSTTALSSFYWRDTLPAALRLDKIVTGTYNVQGNYKIVYKTNLSGETYRVIADNLSTFKNSVVAASPAALGLASNEYVTEVMFVFGVVPSNFRQVEAPQIHCNVVSWLKNGAQFVNQADVGGVHNGQWIMATDRWVTTVYTPTKPSKPLPRTGY